MLPGSICPSSKLPGEAPPRTNHLQAIPASTTSATAYCELDEATRRHRFVPRPRGQTANAPRQCGTLLTAKPDRRDEHHGWLQFQGLTERCSLVALHCHDLFVRVSEEDLHHAPPYIVPSNLTTERDRQVQTSPRVLD